MCELPRKCCRTLDVEICQFFLLFNILLKTVESSNNALFPYKENYILNKKCILEVNLEFFFSDVSILYFKITN